MKPRAIATATATTLLLACGLGTGPARADGELRLSASERERITSWRAEAEWRGSQRLPAPAGSGLSLGWNLLAAHERTEGSDGRDDSRVNELQLSLEQGSWGFSAGRKIVSWDVGYGWRPNDVVQREQRRTLAGTTQPGRPLLQAEYFGSDSALSLVWVNPQHRDDQARGADEAALAGRAYWRLGALDLHGFARAGRHSGGSVGTAFVWVASDALAVHGSLRALQRADERGGSGSGGGSGQALVGFNWTGAARQSVIAEAWHDGSAPSDAQWRAWGNRPRAALGPNLRRDNLFARLAWQPEPWLFSLDALVTPADGGTSVTAALQWQGDRWRLNAALRHLGGRNGSVIEQLPGRHQALLMASWSF